MSINQNAGTSIAIDGPLSRLNSDVLWLIFIANTELASHYGHDRLDTARSSSQVCRRWRQVLLSSSSLWGRLIDLDHLYVSNVNGDNRWRDEILSRSGSSLLWIQGYVDSRTQDFIFSFLDQNWTRIQRVDISIGDRSISCSTSNTTAWDGLERIAPHLQAFNVSPRGTWLPRLVSDVLNSCLLTAGAPLLQELSIPGVRFDIADCSWLANIRRITLSHPFTIPEIFEVLAKTQLLESLEIVGKAGQARKFTSSYEIYTDLPTLRLPQLNELILRAHFTIAFPFLERIYFGDSCRLYIALKEEYEWNGRRNRNSDDMELETEKLQVIQRRITQLLRGHLATFNVTGISFDCREDYLHFSGHTDIERSNYFSINGYFGVDSGPAILEDILLSGCLSRIRELTMYIRIGPSLLSCFNNLPSSLCSLSVLQTNEDNLKFFLENKAPSCLPFPALNTMKLTQLNPSFSRSTYPSQVIWDFFQWQIAGGCPISCFDLTNMPYQEIYDMDYLDNVVGLQTVRWVFPEKGIMQYECGSGKPETLRFRQNWQSHLRNIAELRKRDQDTWTGDCSD